MAFVQPLQLIFYGERFKNDDCSLVRHRTRSLEPTNDELFLIACYLSGKDYQKSKQEAEHRKRVFKEMLDTIYKVQAE